MNIIFPNLHTPEEARAVLSQDILERDADTFVHQSKSNRLGWEAVLPEGDSYSAYLVGRGDTKTLLKKAYRHASNMLAAMAIPKKVRIEVSHQEDSGWTDDTVVCASTKHFDLDTLTPGQKMDIFTGTVVHEGSHLLYTDFGTMERITDGFARMVYNVIEDERIEHLTGQDKPGLANFLKVSKWFYFSSFCEENRKKLYKPKGEEKPLDRATRLFNAFLKLVRYRSALTDAEVAEFADPLVEIHDALVPYPMTSSDSEKKSLEVAEILRKHFSRKDRQQGGDPSEEEPDKEMSKDEMDALTDELADIFKKLIRVPAEDLEEDDECQDVQDDPDLNKVLSGKCAGTGEEGEIVTFMEPDDDAQRSYGEAFATVRQYVPVLRNALMAETFNEQTRLTGLRSGILDPGRLAEAYQGVQSVYYARQERVQPNRTAICLLIDESGSMSYPDASGKSRRDYAEEAAILLEAGAGSNPDTPLFIYGYTNDWDHSLNLNVYREGRQFKRRAVGMLESCGGTPTGEAVRAATARVREKTREKCILVVVTDGEANDNDLLAESIGNAVHDNFIPIGIGVQTDQSNLSDFPTVVMFDNLRDFARDLGRTVKDTVRRMGRRM